MPDQTPPRTINLWRSRAEEFRRSDRRRVGEATTQHCEVCGRALRPPLRRHVMVEVDVAGWVIDGPPELICARAPRDSESQGWFFTGRDCARRIGLIR